MRLLYDIIDTSTHNKPLCWRERLTKYIKQLLRHKKHAWIAAKRTHDCLAFQYISRTVKAAIGQHCRCREYIDLSIYYRSNYYYCCI